MKRPILAPGITMVLLTLLALLPQAAAAQTADSAPAPKISYLPKVDGAVKARVEMSAYDGEYRFNVRNSRFGLSGNVSPAMDYRIQVDFSNEGKLSVLDSYIGYTAGRFRASIGQQNYRFSTDMTRGPNANLFSNRSFLAKYLTSYFGEELSGGKTVGYVRTIGTRDLGAMFSYDIPVKTPLKAYFGLFNGSGINNPEWGKSVNVITRLEAGGETGFRAAASYYTGFTPNHIHIRDGADPMNIIQSHRIHMLGGELRYVKGNVFVEGEYAQRRLMIGGGKMLTAAHVHGYYRIVLPKNATMHHISPIARWDIGDNVDYLNTATKQVESFTANRITAGINFGFVERFIKSELRLNYEKYFLKRTPSDFSVNKLLQDKFTIEVIASF